MQPSIHTRGTRRRVFDGRQRQRRQRLQPFLLHRQSASGTFTWTETGNSVTGSYTKNEQGNEVYSSQETGTGDENFTLTISGSISYSDDETGNRVTGAYTRTKTGTDSFQIDVNGTKTGGTYSQTVMGIESFTLTDTGNLGTGAYSRTIEGDGFCERTSTGDGATQPSDTGAIDYLFAQSADPHSGTFDASWTGTTRYDLLEDFHDISNTQPGRSPGHMNFYPFGQPFVDPNRPIGGIGMMPPGGWPADWSPEWEAGQRSDRESVIVITSMLGGAAAVNRLLPLLRGAGAAGAAISSGRIFLQPNIPRLVAVLNGRVIAQTGNTALSHAEFVRRFGVPAGAWVGTVIKDPATNLIFAFNSRSIMGNQMPAPLAIIEVLRAVFE